MGIYMKYDNAKGAVTTDGFKCWIELESFEWGADRNMQSAQRGATTESIASPRFMRSSLQSGRTFPHQSSFLSRALRSAAPMCRAASRRSPATRRFARCRALRCRNWRSPPKATSTCAGSSGLIRRSLPVSRATHTGGDQGATALKRSSSGSMSWSWRHRPTSTTSPAPFG